MTNTNISGLTSEMKKRLEYYLTVGGFYKEQPPQVNTVEFWDFKHVNPRTIKKKQEDGEVITITIFDKLTYIHSTIKYESHKEREELLAECVK